MKKTLLFALALVAAGCAEPIPRNLADLVQQGEVYLDRETMRPYSGPVFRFFPNDTTRVQLSGNLKDGKLDGPYERYHENGQLQEKATYAAGEYDGPYERYYENGQLRTKATYKDVEYHGPFESYHRNGQLELKTTYAAGEEDGPYEWYDSDGGLWQRGTFTMGEQCGEWIVYNPRSDRAARNNTIARDPCPPGN